MKINKLQKGYSILELVIYIALFSIIVVVIINSLLTITKTYSTAQGYRRLQSNGDLIMDRIAREIRSSNTIVSATYNTNPGSISLSGVDSIGGTKSSSFSITNGVLQINDNGNIGDLSTSEVVVTSLIFRNITTANSLGIKVEMTLTTANGYIVSAPFYSTILLRNK